MSGETEPTTDPVAAQADAGAAHDADRPPTPEEERVAEEQAAQVDPGSGEHYREMAERGADVEGEGEIVPE
jgi:hypothetical protein